MSARESLIALVLVLCISSVGLANSGAFPLAETPHWVAVSLQLPRPVDPLVVPWEMHRLHSEHCPEETCYFVEGVTVETVYRDLARLMRAREHRLVMELPGELQMWHASPHLVFMIFLLAGFENGVVLRVLD